FLFAKHLFVAATRHIVFAAPTSLPPPKRSKTACSKKAFSGMGRTLHEVFRIREVRVHRTGGTVVALNPPDTGSNRDPEIDVLRLVQPIPGGRDRSSGGWQAKTAADLE